MLTVALIVTPIVLLVAISSGMTMLFPGFASTDFRTHEAYIAHHLRQQLLCRELHILSALLIGAVDGAIICCWNGYSPLPMLIAAATIEVSWLLFTKVIWKPSDQSYMEWRQIGAAVVGGVIAGAVACILASAAISPLLIGGAVTLISFFLLMPL